MAERGSSSDSTERPLYNAGQPSRCEGPLRSVVQPFSAGAWLTLTDPMQTIDAGQSRRSPARKRTLLDAISKIALVAAECSQR